MVTWSALVWTQWFWLTVRQVCCQGHYDNVALNKSCKLSSYFGPYENDGSFLVNNNTNGYLDLNPYTNCIQTDLRESTTPGQYNSWWEVNLGRPYPVYSITVWGRLERFGTVSRRMARSAITVDGTMCYTFPDNTDSWPQRMDINCTQGTVNGNVVRLEKNVDQSVGEHEATLTLCEFQVWSCSARYWDSGCDQMCGECRDGAPCDKVTGHCDSGCKNPGRQPPLCTQECLDNSFGLDCRETCSRNCKDVCDKVNGSCTCNPGWKGLKCLEMCEAGHYGVDCAVCGACMGGVPCHHVNGSCQQCEDNYRLPLCKECSAGHYGLDCSGVCGACNNGAPCNVRDGSCDSCEGNFMTPLCKECAESYNGPDCRLPCGENCEGKVCDRDTGHCTCKPGWAPPNCTKLEAMASIGDGYITAVAALGSVVAFTGVLVLVLVVVVIILIRRIRDMQHLQQKAPVRPTDIQMEVSRTFTTYENTQVPEEAAIEVDLSNYDRLEVYENKKDITNVYTDLTVNKR